MALGAAFAAFLRLRGGQTLWTVATGAVPSLSLLSGEPLWIAVVLFWAETALATLLVGARVAWRWQAARRAGDEAGRRALADVGRLLSLLVGGFNLTLGVIGGVVLFGMLGDEAVTPEAIAQCVARLQSLAVALLAAACYDTLLAPTSSVRWLQGVAAWQWSRTAVLFFGLAVAGLAGLAVGERGALWGFLAVRVLTDLGALRASERERIRAQVFGDAPA